MSYKKTIWKNGVTPVSEEIFNNIENGIETLDKGLGEVGLQLSQSVQQRKLKQNEELNTLLQSYDNILIDIGTYEITTPIRNLTNKSIKGIDKDKSILKLNDDCFFDMLNVSNLSVSDLTIQVSIYNTNDILNFKILNNPKLNGLTNVNFTRVKIVAIDYSNTNNTNVNGLFTGLSMSSTGGEGIFGCKFDLTIINPKIGFRIYPDNGGWITNNIFDLTVKQFSDMAIDLEMGNFYVNNINCNIYDGKTTTRTGLKIGSNVHDNTITSIRAWDDNGVGLTVIDCDSTAYNNAILSGYVEGNIKGKEYLFNNNYVNFTWYDMLNRASGSGIVSSKIETNNNNIIQNGNFVNPDTSNLYMNGTMTKELIVDEFADFGKVMRLTEKTISDSAILVLQRTNNFLRDKTITFTVKAKTKSKDFKIAIDTSSGGFFGGKYHSGNGEFEIISLTIKVPNITGLYVSPMLLLNDSIINSYVDIAWITLSIGCLTPTQYIPCNM